MEELAEWGQLQMAEIQLETFARDQTKEDYTLDQDWVNGVGAKETLIVCRGWQ